MENKFSEAIHFLVEDVFPKQKEILTVFLYGSVYRGDYSFRHSDLDLFMVLKHKKINAALKEKLDNLILSVEAKFGVKIHTEYQGLEIKEEDKTLVEKMLSESKIIYSSGVFSFGTELIGLKPFLIYDFWLKESNNKTLFSKVLHGRKSWYYHGKEKIIKNYPGIIDKTHFIELGRGALMVSQDKEEELKQIFENFGVRYQLKKRVYVSG